jgi:RNA polymerase sigma factor (sigma-70 family)
MTTTLEGATLKVQLEGRELEDLIREHLPLVGHLVRQTLGRLPAHVSREDLVSAGIAALAGAAKAFDPSRGIPFGSFATTRIRGAILDELRGLDWASRSVRARARQVDAMQQELTAALGRTPTNQELAEALGVSVDELQSIDDDVQRAAVLSLQGFAAGSAEDMVPERAAGPVFSLCWPLLRSGSERSRHHEHDDDDDQDENQHAGPGDPAGHVVQPLLDHRIDGRIGHSRGEVRLRPAGATVVTGPHQHAALHELRGVAHGRHRVPGRHPERDDVQGAGDEHPRSTERKSRRPAQRGGPEHRDQQRPRRGPGHEPPGQPHRLRVPPPDRPVRPERGQDERPDEQNGRDHVQREQ